MIGRARELHRELAAVAELDPRWWLVAAGAAIAERLPARTSYVISDAEPGADTFMGYREAAPADPIVDAVLRAHAALAALQGLDGTLPDQPLAVTLRRNGRATLEPSALDVAAFAIGEVVVHARLAARIEDEAPLVARLRAVVAGDATAEPQRAALERPGAVPFVCVSIGDEALATARHGHRRAWRELAGPWLGLGRADELAIVSTCHLVVDGYGHARLTGAVSAELARLRTERAARALGAIASVRPMPPLAVVEGSVPLGIAWRELPVPAPGALALAYRLGLLLHAHAGDGHARFSPTLQIPVAPGARDDLHRLRRRVVPAVTSVRFAQGEPEPFEAFDTRTRAILASEATGEGLCAGLLAAARAMPLSLAWKRRTFSATRPPWLDRVAEVIGGRACVSRLRIETALPALCAVSSPARLATEMDPSGACVVTLIDDGVRAAITVCGSGLAGSHADAEALLDELVSDASSDRTRRDRRDPARSPANRR